jgi:D-3-phosphoglycerate dehydrogenase
LVGLGAIGRAVAERLRPFGPSVRYTTRRQLDAGTEERLGVTYASLPELLASSTIVSLHLPLSEETRHLIGAAELAQMQPGSLLINTSRGGLVDEAALRDALKRGHLGGAGLDVLQQERAGGNPFTDLPNVIVTSHISGSSRPSGERIVRMAAANIARVLAGEPPQHLVPGSMA